MNIGNSSQEPSEGLKTANERVKELIHRGNNDEQRNFDVIVFGVGSMGSSTCYYLAKQGVKVLGLEQFDIPNELSSHAGQSRIIRKAYFENPDYVPLLEKAYQNWKHLENISGMQVYVKTGLLYFAKSDHWLMKGVHESAAQYNIKLDTLGARDMKAKYPQINVSDDYEKLFEPEAGFLTPERAILLYTDQALKLGAVIKPKTKVLQWRKTSEGIEVTTIAGTFYAKKIVITAGPWTGKMMEDLSASLVVTRQTIAWVITEKNSLFELDTLPCWMLADDAKPGVFYGFPILPVGKFNGPIGFKLAHHYPGPISDPDTISRMTTADDEANLVDTLKKFFPYGYKATHTMKTCMYSNTPDENFILDFLPNHDKDVVVAAGFSGHGFKFASVVGEIMSDLAIKGSTALPIGFLNASRFRYSSKR